MCLDFPKVVVPDAYVHFASYLPTRTYCSKFKSKVATMTMTATQDHSALPVNEEIARSAHSLMQ